jgi:hypothetical protein
MLSLILLLRCSVPWVQFSIYNVMGPKSDMSVNSGRFTFVRCLITRTQGHCDVRMLLEVEMFVTWRPDMTQLKPWTWLHSIRRENRGGLRREVRWSAGCVYTNFGIFWTHWWIWMTCSLVIQSVSQPPSTIAVCVMVESCSSGSCEIVFKHWLSWPCSTHGRNEKYVKNVGQNIWREEATLKN